MSSSARYSRARTPVPPSTGWERLSCEIVAARRSRRQAMVVAVAELLYGLREKVIRIGDRVVVGIDELRGTTFLQRIDRALGLEGLAIRRRARPVRRTVA